MSSSSYQYSLELIVNNMSSCNRTCRLISSLRQNFKFLSSSTALKPGINIQKLHTSNILSKNVAFKLSDIGEGIREVVIKEWFVKVGDKVSQFENICEVQSDKASVTITSRYDGVITKLHHSIDDTVLVGNALIDIETEDEEITEQSTENVENKGTPQEKECIADMPSFEKPKSYKTEICIPSVRRLAKQNNIDLSQVQGTGKDGRILKEDVLRYMQREEKLEDEASLVSEKVFKVQADKTVPITNFQRAMVKTMTEALKIPHFVYSDEISVLNLKKVRSSIKSEMEKNNLKISFMPFFIKAASNALLRYPILNSSLDKTCENVTYKANHNIGIAMDTAVGLAVPVIKNVEQLNIVEIANKLNQLMQSGKSGNFSTDDLSGGTFSISNIGIIGGTYTKPVILPPQVAIMAIGVSKAVPKFDEANNVIYDEIVCVSGAADHRIIDGVTMANFVSSIKKQIENPYLLFLNF